MTALSVPFASTPSPAVASGVAGSVGVRHALLAFLAVAVAVGLVVRRRARAYDASPDSDPETAFHLRRLRRRGVAVGWALTAAATWAGAVPDAVVAPIESLAALALGAGAAAVVAGVVGTLAAYILPGVLVALAVRLATLPYRRSVRNLRVRYRDAAAWELERDGVGVVAVLGAAAVIATAPSGWPRVFTAVGLGFLATALAPLALVVALKTRWPTDDERATVADLLPAGVRLRVVDDRTRAGSALAAGIVPGLEYVYVTESLFAVLDDDELRAVVAHEVGHHERNHVLLRFSLVALAAAAVLALASFAPGTAVLAILAGALPFAVGLAWVVRATERSADAYAAAAVGGPALASALETLAERRYVMESTGLLTVFAYHPPLGERIDRLRDVRESPATATATRS